MDTSDTVAIDDRRLRRLETLARGSLALWIVTLSVGLLAAAGWRQDPSPDPAAAAVDPQREPQQVLRASAFELVDGGGSVRARLGFEDGDPVLRLLDDQQRGRVRLFWTDDGGGLYLEDPEGVTRLGAALFEHGGAGFALHGRESKGAAVLYWKDEGRLTFYDTEGRITGRFPSQDK